MNSELLGYLVVLGVTSTDGMIRRLGKAWPRLHKSVYLIAILGLIHYYLQAKIDVSDPVFWTGAFLLLMAAGIGVVVAITPWNYPLHQVVAKVAPALVATPASRRRCFMGETPSGKARP